MEDIYEDETYDQPEPKRGMSGWLIALLVVVVLLILCCICVFAALLLLGPALGTTFSTVIETVEAFTPVP
jgi:flagellar basal body-associated protein FliL